MSREGAPASAGVGVVGLLLVASGLLWWYGHLFATWTLFSVVPGDMTAKKSLAITQGTFHSLGDCRVEAAISRAHGGVAGDLGRHVFFCGLACEASEVFPDGSAIYDATKCRRLEPE